MGTGSKITSQQVYRGVTESQNRNWLILDFIVRSLTNCSFITYVHMPSCFSLTNQNCVHSGRDAVEDFDGNAFDTLDSFLDFCITSSAWQGLVCLLDLCWFWKSLQSNKSLLIESWECWTLVWIFSFWIFSFLCQTKWQWGQQMLPSGKTQQGILRVFLPVWECIKTLLGPGDTNSAVWLMMRSSCFCWAQPLLRNAEQCHLSSIPYGRNRGWAGREVPAGIRPGISHQTPDMGLPTPLLLLHMAFPLSLSTLSFSVTNNVKTAVHILQLSVSRYICNLGFFSAS